MLKRYETYKDSGAEWIGEIPEKWESVKLKWISDITKGRKPKKEFDQQKESALPYLSMEFLRDKTSSPTYIDVDERGIVLVDENDLLILWDGSKAGEIVKAKKGVLSSTMAKIEITDDKFNSQYLNYLLVLAERHIQSQTIGMGIPHVSGNVLKNIPMLVPSRNEQTQIAAYLNHQTNLIDTIIAQKEQLIEKLKEQRQAIINEAVTKGLKSNAPLKDSGVEWLGEIPEHWDVFKIKHLAELKSGNFISAGEIEPEGKHPVYGGNGLRGYTTSYTHEGDYILIGRQGALCGNINYAHKKFWATEHAVVVSFKKRTDVVYFGELLRSMNLNQYNESAAQPGLAVGKIDNLYIPKISIEEQKEIADFIQEHIKKSQELLDKTQKSIKKLKEYRQSIISEAVTGKIDVRDWKPENA